MALEINQRLPDATFLELQDGEPKELSTSELFSGRRVVVFALPGAFTRTCSARHLPSFVGSADAIREKGIDDIVCLAVNDPFVMRAWGDAHSAIEAGIRMIGDSSGEFTKAVDMGFTVPSRGYFGRSTRYSMVVENGVVTQLFAEPGLECEISAGETMVEKL